uniref:Caffeic acid 3-O-methyltransferase-like n=1 Tax=Tanacetum cinerariifolium TaxID=118510 RepID=A0A6L2J4Q4_TANCI|nr:caffeic acid 3-O-methyltransferase-like [Tanacetum cinerariifolium]
MFDLFGALLKIIQAIPSIYSSIILSSQECSACEMGSIENEFTYAMQLVTSTSLAMVLVTTINLKVFDAMAEVGPNARLSAKDIASRLSIPNQDAPNMLDRMLRLLASHSVVTCSQVEHESTPVRLYGLAPVAKYFITNKDGVSLVGLMELFRSKECYDSWFKLKDSVIDGGFPFENFHGTPFFKYMASEANTTFKEVFDNAMVGCTQIVTKEFLECYHGFDDIECLVDVGGGIGVTLDMIISKYPTIKGINFDLPYVTQHAPHYHGIEHVAGDMFQEVPKGDAIFMKWILHDWNDDDCTKLLKNCYKALPAHGKAIVLDGILPFIPDTSYSCKFTTQIDSFMMALLTGGKERTYDEFLILAKTAGFAGIRKECLEAIKIIVAYSAMALLKQEETKEEE